jgi:hypothetical protein
MSKFFLFFGIFLVSEIILAFVFAIIASIIYRKETINLRTIYAETISSRKRGQGEKGSDKKMGFHPVIKGIVERSFLLIALVNDYPHALTLFSALKLGTRLKHKDSSGAAEDDFNDFYLVGNLISVSVAIGYTTFFKFLMKT